MLSKSHECGQTGESTSKNLLMVVVDSLRTDRLSKYGYHRETSPFLDSLPALYFPHAISPAPWTYPAVASILTGLFPHEHKAGNSGIKRTWGDIHDGELRGISEDIQTLPEILDSIDYQTYGETAITPVELAVGDRFDHFQSNHHQSGEAITENFLKWLGDSDPEKWFGYLHLGDIHGWDKPPESETRPTPTQCPFGHIDDHPDSESVNWEDPEDRHRFLNTLDRIYDTQLHYVDSVIQSVWQTLENIGEASETVMVVTADHGEGFCEHADELRDVFNHPNGPPYGVTHGTSLFSEVLNVPILIVGAGMSGEYKRRVSTTDLVPTLLHNLDLDTTLSNSFSGEILTKDSHNRKVCASQIGQGYKQRAIYAGDYKLIKQYRDDVTLLYRLDDQQREQSRVENSTLKTELASYLPNVEFDEQTNTDELAFNTKERLRDLGYVD
jgi:arylsulfatase A-like enzyme